MKLLLETLEQTNTSKMGLPAEEVNKHNEIIDIRKVTLSQFVKWFSLGKEEETNDFCKKVILDASNLDQTFLDSMKDRSIKQKQQFLYHTIMNNQKNNQAMQTVPFTLYEAQEIPKKYVMTGEKISYDENHKIQLKNLRNEVLKKVVPEVLDK